MKLTRLLLALALGGLSFAAAAQWQWIDKDGHKVFSDRAPPPEIADKNIVKRPAGRTPALVPVSDEANGTDAAPTAAVPLVAASGDKKSGLDKELEAKRKLAKDAEVAKRKADEERVTKAKIENCARAKQAKTTFESGVRIGHTNAAGEREIMDDPTRAAEVKRIQEIMARDCR